MMAVLEENLVEAAEDFRLGWKFTSNKTTNQNAAGRYAAPPLWLNFIYSASRNEQKYHWLDAKLVEI